MPASAIGLTGVSPSIEGLQWEAIQHLRIGRRPNLEVVLNDPSVSREHAELYCSSRGWMIRDLKSSTGTLVNGVPVGETTRRLQRLDVVQCGQLVLQVTRLQEEAPPVRALPKGPANIRTTAAVVRIQSQSGRSWEQGLLELDPSDPKLAQGKHLLTLLRGGYHLARIHCPAELLQTLLTDIAAVLEAQRGSIALLDEASGRLAARAVYVDKSCPSGTKLFSTTLIERCYYKGESFLCRDVQAEGEQGPRGEAQGPMASTICALLRSPRRRLGVLYLDRDPQQPPFTQEHFALTEAIATTIAAAIETALTVEKQTEALFPIAQGLALLALNARGESLARHGRRVGSVAAQLAAELRLPRTEIQLATIVGVLHDLGRADGAPAHEHATRGASLLEATPGLEPLAPILRHHHEHWDGRGSPAGLVGESIPRLARILAAAEAVVELLDAPEESRCPPAEALARVRRRAGSEFDPECVNALERLWLNQSLVIGH